MPLYTPQNTGQINAESVRASGFRGNRQLKLLVDGTRPTTQTFPTTTAAANTLTGLTFSEVFVAAPSRGVIGRPALGVTGSAGTILTKSGTPRIGLLPGWNGIDHRGHRGFEIVDPSADNLTVADTSFWNVGNLTIFFCMRACKTPAASRRVMGKSALDTTSAGWHVYVSGISAGGDGQLILNVFDSTPTGVASSAPGVGLDGPCFGGLVWGAVRFNTTTGKAQLHTRYGNGTEVTIPAGTVTNSTAWTWGVGGVKYGLESSQLFWLGSVASALTSAQVDAALVTLDKWCREPVSLGATSTPTYSRTSPAMSTEWDPSFGWRHCVVYGSSLNTGYSQVPYEWMKTSPTSGVRGILRERSISGTEKKNLILRSHDLTDNVWTKSNTTITDFAGEGPSGMKDAQQVLSSGSNGQVYQVVATTASVQPYTFSCEVQLTAPKTTNVTGRLMLYDTVGASEIASISWTATFLNERISLYVPSVPSTGTRCVLEIDNHADAVYASAFQMEPGVLSSIIPTRGTIVTRAQDALWWSNAGSAVFNTPAGEVEVGVVQRVTDAGYATTNSEEYAFIFSTGTRTAGVNDNRQDMHFIYRLSQEQDISDNSHKASYRSYTATGLSGSEIAHLSEGPAADTAQPTRYRIAWHAAQGWTQFWVDGVEVTMDPLTPGTAQSPWTTGAGVTEITAGSWGNNTSQIDGIVTFLATYSLP